MQKKSNNKPLTKKRFESILEKVFTTPKSELRSEANIGVSSFR